MYLGAPDSRGRDGGQPVEAGSGGAASVRQTARAHVTSGTTASVSPSEGALSGSLLAVTVFSNTRLTVSSVSGGGVTQWNVGPDSSPPDGAQVTYWGVTTGGGADVTVTFSGQITYAELYSVEIVGATGVDTEDTTTGSSVAPTVPAMTLAGPGEVIVTQSWLQGGAVTAVTDNGFVDSYAPVGESPGAFQSYDVLGQAATYTPERYATPRGLWYSQAIAFKPGGSAR